MPGEEHRYALDRSCVFDAGRAVPVSGNTAAILSGSWLAKHFRARRAPVPPSPEVWRAVLGSQAMHDGARHPEPAGQASCPGNALGQRSDSHHSQRWLSMRHGCAGGVLR